MATWGGGWQQKPSGCLQEERKSCILGRRMLTISMDALTHFHVLLLRLNVLQALAKSDDGLLQRGEVL